MTHAATAVSIVRRDGEHLTLFAYCSCAPDAIGIFRGTFRPENTPCPEPANPAHERGGTSAMCWSLENGTDTITGHPSLDLSGGPAEWAHFHTGNPWTLPVRAQ